MCGVIARTGAQPFRRVSRSVRIGGHATSIQLEAAFWDVLETMAAREGVTVPQLLGTLHEETWEEHGSVRNFASTLRTICLLWQAAPG